MTFDAEKLYNLLPAIYRIRDAGQGGPLKQLLYVLAEQALIVEEDLAQLYDDQFIETCADWVIPYIGDLIGFKEIRDFRSTDFSQRAEVANTISARRRKGTASLLNDLVRDVTGWHPRVREYFELLATTQYMNHIRPSNLSLSSIRQWELLEEIDGPFNQLTHNIDVRSITSGRGLYNISNIGIFLWRINPYALRKSPAPKVDGDDRRYTFSPLGNNLQLFNLPHSSEAAEEISAVPTPISRLMMLRSIKMHQSLSESTNDYYGQDKSILIRVGDEEKTHNEITVCRLDDIYDSEGFITGWTNMPETGNKISIDPELGRIALPPGQGPKNVEVTFHYGFSADMGGGSYQRKPSFSKDLEKDHGPIKVPGDHDTIQDALNDRALENGVIEITDSGRYEEFLAITLKEEQKIEIRAAEGERPTLVLKGDINVDGKSAELSLNGLLISGGSLIVSNRLKRLRLVHSTLVPGQSLSKDGPSTGGFSRSGLPQNADSPSLIIALDDNGSQIEIEIDHSITGAIRSTAESAIMVVKDSIIDSPARDRRARTTRALVSGELSQILLTSSQPAVDVIIAGDGPYRANFSAVPSDLDQARDFLEDAIHNAHHSPGFTEARVLVAENKLVILPGVEGDVAILASKSNNSNMQGQDPTANELAMDQGSAQHWLALVGGKVSTFSGLSSTRPSLKVGSSQDEFTEVEFSAHARRSESSRSAASRSY